MIPYYIYSDNYKRFLNNKLCKIQKLHELHKIILASWAGYENDASYLKDVELYELYQIDNQYYVSPSNAFLYDYGIKPGYRNSNIEYLGLAAYFVIRGIFGRANSYLNSHKPSFETIHKNDVCVERWTISQSHQWWKSQKEIYAILKQANI